MVFPLQRSNEINRVGCLQLDCVVVVMEGCSGECYIESVVSGSRLSSSQPCT